MKKIYSSLRQVAFCAVAALALAACSKLTAENFSKIQAGMTEQAVIQVLGNPTKMESGSFLGITGSVYIYKSGDKTVRVNFVNGKVMAKEGSL